MSVLFCVVFATLGGRCPASGVSATDWPQWRGPARDGSTPENGWSVEGREGESWTFGAGLGYSSFAVQDGCAFTMGYDTILEEDVVFCLDVETGEELWSFSYPATLGDEGHQGGTLSSPSAEPGRVFVKNREGKLFCLDAESGEVLWQKDLATEYAAREGIWGFSSSPLVLEDMLVIDAGIAFAFDKQSGELLWKTPDYGQAYATPTEFQLEGRRLLAALNATGLVILDRGDGAEVCRYPWKTPNDINTMSPLVIGDRIFVSSGIGCAMLRLHDGALTPVWESQALRSGMSLPILFANHLVGFDGAVLKCLDLDGNERWRERGLGQGSLIVAGDRFLVMSETGTLVVAEASVEEFRRLHEREVFAEGPCWTVPVLSGGRIFCRNSNGEVVCLDHRRVGP